MKEITIKKELKIYRNWLRKHRIYFIIIDMFLILFVSFLVRLEINFYKINGDSPIVLVESLRNSNIYTNYQDWYNFANDYNKYNIKWKIKYVYSENGIEKNYGIYIIKNICGVQKNIYDKKLCVFIYGDKYNIEGNEVKI